MKLILSKYYLLFFCTTWFYFLSSLNSPPFHFVYNLSSFITFIRGIAPILIFTLLIAYFIFTKFNKKLNFNLLDLLIIIYFVSQIFAYIYAYGWDLRNDIYWPIAGLSLVFFLEFANSYDRKNLINFLNVTVLLIALLSGYLIYQIFDEYYLNFNNINYYFNTSWYSAQAIAELTELNGQEIPRSSGLARMLFIVFIYLLVVFMYTKNLINNKIKYLILGPLIFIFSFCVWHLQNRGVLVYYFILLFFFLLPFDYLTYKKKFLYLIIFCIIPFILHSVEPVMRKNLLLIINPNVNIQNNAFVKKYRNYKFENGQEIILSDNSTFEMPEGSTLVIGRGGTTTVVLKNGDEITLGNRDLAKNGNDIGRFEVNKGKLNTLEIFALSNRFVQPYVYKSRDTKNETDTAILSNSSGRVDLWKLAIPLIKRNYIGYGPQADRIYIKQNISNILFYSLMCGGIISFMSIIGLIFLIIFKIFILVFKHKIFKKNNFLYEKISIILLGFLLLRGMVEISFGIYSVDMIFFLVAAKIIYNSSIYDKKTS